jgi:hypothetical protein
MPNPHARVHRFQETALIIDPTRRPSRRTLVLGAAALCIAPPWRQAHAGQAMSIEGFTFPGEVTVAGTTLHLNGVGVRQVAWLKGYASGLYLPQKATQATQALTQTGPKRVSMRMIIDAPSEEFAKAFMRGVTRNAVPGDLPKMQERMKAFDATVRAIGKLKRGDQIDVEWRPAEGTTALVNGKQQGKPVPGEDIYTAMLKIYIGDRPTDDKMKAGLLGARP